MRKILTACAILSGATAIAFGLPGGAHAAPVSTGNAMLDQAAPSAVVDVRHWRRGAWIAGAAAAGFVAGAAIASRRHYYYEPYAYEPDSYGPYAPYAYEPYAYYVPAPVDPYYRPHYCEPDPTTDRHC